MAKPGVLCKEKHSAMACIQKIIGPASSLHLLRYAL